MEAFCDGGALGLTLTRNECVGLGALVPDGIEPKYPSASLTATWPLVWIGAMVVRIASISRMIAVAASLGVWSSGRVTLLMSSWIWRASARHRAGLASGPR